MRKYFLVSTLLFISQIAQSQSKAIDTLTIYCDCIVSKTYPTKLKIFHKGESTYSDTINACSAHETCRIPIFKNNQYYYLVVYSKDSIKRYEGEFFDRHHCGTYILYDWNGNKAHETIYRLKDLPENPSPSLTYHEIITSSEYRDGRLYKTEDYLKQDDTFYTVTITEYNKKGKAKRRRKKTRF